MRRVSAICLRLISPDHRSFRCFSVSVQVVIHDRGSTPSTAVSLYGLTTLQAYIYYTRNSNDSPLLKWLVSIESTMLHDIRSSRLRSQYYG